MTQGGSDSDVLQTLITVFEADTRPLTAAFQQTAQQSQRSGQQVGQQFQQGLTSALSGVGQQAGQQLGAGVTTAVTGQLRNARGQFVSAGTQAGQSVAAGVTAGMSGLTTSAQQTGHQVGQRLSQGIQTGLSSGGGFGGRNGLSSIFTGLTAGVQGSGLLSQLGGLTSGLGSVTGAMGSTLAAAGPLAAGVAGVTAAVGGGIVAMNNAADAWGRYETVLARISTLTDKTTSQLGGVGNSLKEMSRDTGQSIESLGRSMQEVLGASVRGADDLSASLNLVKISAKLAVGGFVDSAVAVDGLTSVLNSYSLSVQDSQAVADAMSKTVLVGKISMQELAGSLGMVTSISSTAGVALNEVLAAIAAMTAGGIQGGQSIEYLRNLISNIIAPSAQAKTLAKQLGIEWNEQAIKAKGLTGVLQDAMKATDGSAGKLKILIGDVGGVAAATAIATGNFSRMNDSLREINNSAGATDEAFGKITVTMEEQGKKLKQSWESLWKNLGGPVADFKKYVMGELTEMLNGLNSFLEKLETARRPQKMAVKVADLEAELVSAKKYLEGGRAIIADPKRGDDDNLKEDWIYRRLPLALNRIRELEAAIAQAKKDQVQAEKDLQAYNIQNGISKLKPNVEGPRLGGTPQVNRDPLATDPNNITQYAGDVLRQTAMRTGKNTADMVVDYCGQWVRLTLGNADKKAKRFIDNLFTGDTDKDGQTTAKDYAQNAKAAGLLRDYKGVQDLRPGDTVFYTEGGQNHVGIYIGGGMVRGNNRVTYAENGGKFDAKGNPISRGVNPVGDVAIDRLGTPNSYVRTSDLGRAAGLGERALRLDAPEPTSGGGSGGTKAAPKITAAQIAEALRLRDALEAAQDALEKSPRSVPLIQALAQVKREVADFQKGTAGNKEAWENLGKDATKTAGTYIASAREIRTYGTQALLLVKDLEAAEKSGSAEARGAARARVDAWIGESKARKSVFDLEGQAYAYRKQQADKAEGEDKQRSEARTALAAQVSADIASGQVKSAQATLTKLKALQTEELAEAGQNQAKRAAIIESTSPQILEAERNINAKVRNQAIGAAQSWAEKEKENGKLTGAAIDAERRRRVAVAYADEARANEQAQQEQTGVVKAAARDRAEYEKKMVEARQAAERALASGQIEVAKTTAQQVIDEYDRQVKAAGDDATKRVLLEQRVGADVLAARNALATATAQGEKLRLEQQRNEEVNKEGLTKDQRTRIWEQYATRIAQIDKGLQTTLQGNAEETTRVLNSAVEASVQLQVDAQTALNASTIEGMRLKQQAAEQMQAAAQRALDQAQEDADRLKAKLIAIADAAREGERDGLSLVSQVRGDPSAYADGGGRGGPDTSAQVEQNYRDFAAAIDELTASDLENVEAMRLVEEAFTGAAKAGGITERQLQSLIDKLHNLKTAADLVAQRDALMGAPVGIRTGNERPDSDMPAGSDPLAMTPEEAAAARTAYNTLIESLGEMDAAQLAVQLSMARLTKDADLENRVLEAQAKQVRDNATALRELPALMAQLDLNKLERGHSAGGMNEEWYVTERERLETIAENANWEVQKKGLTGQVLENAEAQHQDRLAAITAKGSADRAAIQKKAITEATQSAESFRQAQLEGARADLEHEHAQKLISEREYIDRKEAMDTAAAHAEYAAVVAAHGDVATAGVTLQNRLTAISREGAAARKEVVKDEFQKLIEMIGQVGDIFTRTSKLLGADSQTQEGIGQLFTGAQDAVTAFMKFSSGDILGGVQASLSAILNIGDGIENINSEIKAWKKGLLEVAAIEKDMAGSKTYGNIANPYYNTLNQDAANREKLAGSKWYERLWWGITGTGPQVMEDGAAKLTASAAEIFGDMAQTISQTLDESMMNAFETGDWSGTEEAFDKSINGLIARMTLAAITKASGIGEKIQAYADARAKATADGVITPEEQAELDRQMKGIGEARDGIQRDFKGAAEGLPGYGAGAKDDAPAGSIAGLEKEVSDLTEKYNKATTQAERDSLKAEIDRLNERIKALKGERDNSLEQSQLQMLGQINQLRAKLATTTDEKTRASIQGQIDDLTTALGDLGSVQIKLPVAFDPVEATSVLQLDVLGSLSEAVKIYVPQFALGVQDFKGSVGEFAGGVREFGGGVATFLAGVDRFDRITQQKERDWTPLRTS